MLIEQSEKSEAQAEQIPTADAMALVKHMTSVVEVPLTHPEHGTPAPAPAPALVSAYLLLILFHPPTLRLSLALSRSLARSDGPHG